MKQEELKVTSADEYVVLPEPQAKLHKMPSGAVWLIAMADMEDLALVGAIPMSLVSSVAGDGTSAKEIDVEAEVESSNDKLDDQVTFVRELLREHVIQPALSYGEKGALGVVDSNGTWHKLKRGDAKAAWQIVSGEIGGDGLNSFRNRKQRRAFASKSGRKALQSESLATTAKE